MENLSVDFDFLSEYSLEIIAGRDFDKDRGTDTWTFGYILNEEAVKVFGWASAEDALGKRLHKTSEVIGVVRDFHYQGLQNAIGPLVLWINPPYYNYLTLTVDTGNLTGTLSFLKRKFKELYPADVFQHFFLDSEFNRQYRAEEQVGKLFSIFAFLGIFIACLGLFGLAAFIAEQRKKEIGIRKVLGGSSSSIVVMLLKEFVKWILIANVIAWPLAYYSASKWLEGFAYRTNPALYIFVISTGLALLIAILTVSFQSFKAACANPSDSLRYG
jgi:putative ABC transport system permease protein